MKKVIYKVPNISCGHCVNTIEVELKDLEGVVEVKANSDSKEVEIGFDDPASEEQILELLTEINYPASI